VPETPPNDPVPDELAFPGARRPDRRRWVASSGVRLEVSEWGDLGAPVVLLAHGGFDFAATFDVFAPRLADGGWRVVSWDHRGHGDSQHTPLYSWGADQRDAMAVLDSTTTDPVAVVGHSKGGGVTLDLAQACPHRVSHLVNIDGLPSKRPRPDLADHERTRLLATELTGWLDYRRTADERERRPGTVDELAERRQRMNPRLSLDWLRYLVAVGARRDNDGWRWKLDPGLRFGGFGPWRPEWALDQLPGLAAPLLAIIGLAPEPMGMGHTPESIAPHLPFGARLDAFDDTGHFVHIEQPERVATLVLDFLRA